MSGVLSTDQQSDEFSSMDEQYSCSENEHMTNAGVSGDPYCCDQLTDSTVAKTTTESIAQILPPIILAPNVCRNSSAGLKRPLPIFERCMCKEGLDLNLNKSFNLDHTTVCDS